MKNLLLSYGPGITEFLHGLPLSHTSNLIKNRSSVGLERWTSRQECLLLLQKIRVWFPAPIWVLTPSNYSSREPTLSSGPRELLHIHDAHKLKQARTHIQIISQFSKGQGGLRPSRICEKKSKG